MDRRALLRAAAAAAALPLLPTDVAAAWARALAVPPAVSPFTPTQRATLDALADAIIPSTDTPGALDVGTTDWIAVIVAEHDDATARATYLAQLDAIDAAARATAGAPLPALDAAARARLLDALDRPVDRTAPAARGFARTKGLVVHGYFTSRPVQEAVLQTVVMPGRYDGAAPHTPGAPRPPARDGAQHGHAHG
ncbi:MAG: gluconate 2-dehydrogenase subunit 3 family protein [Gemmatimonadaceae bacterium]|nr:gluconate 2-dehydrogenase subunit 3 family protein [Gemmatimonadaceae bacterium]